jgi:L-amino acid N-acyltransferase YncA
MVTIRPASISDAPVIAAIHNEGIAERSATFETTPRRAADIRERLGETDRFPLLVAVDADGDVLGWAGLGGYRARECNAGIGEFSVYLAHGARGRGIGRQLLEALIAAARERGYWKLLSRIFTFNAASRALCRATGFREVGIYEKHGRLDGRWLDVVVVERLIDENLVSGPLSPTRPAADAAVAL